MTKRSTTAHIQRVNPAQPSLWSYSSLSAFNTRQYRVNSLLLVFSVLLVVGYVVLSNYIVSQDYAAENLKKEASKAEINTQNAGSTTTIADLMVFAREHGMVEAKETDALFEDAGVALSR